MTALFTKPSDVFAARPDQVWSIPPADVDRFRLDAAAQRFEELRGRVAALDRVATALGITAIDSLDDAIPLLFRPDIYKSYPAEWLLQGRFGRITRWLDNLTALDLSAVDVSAAGSVSQWIEHLDRTTDLRLGHSSGTGGALSFMPFSSVEIERLVDCWYFFHQGIGDERTFDLGSGEIPIFFLHYQYGFGPVQRRLGLHFDRVPGAEAACVAMYPYRWDPDVIALRSRAAVAERAGRDPGITDDDHRKLQEADEQRLDAIPRMVTRLPELMGQLCAGSGTWSEMLAVAMEAERRGITRVFHPESPISPGGGFKGGFAGAFDEIPQDWFERVFNFLGVSQFAYTYGMAESTAHPRSCPQGRYHLPPFVVPWVLDPRTGEALPRVGVQTGRYAFLDLLAERYWGGIVTADLVTMHWSEQCPCGRVGAFLETEVSRIPADPHAMPTRADAAHGELRSWLAGA